MNYRLIKNYLQLASRLLPDKLHCDLMYYLHFHKFINWNNPQTFNEKLNWLKLYDRRPEYSTYVDKYKVRDYIAKKIGEEYLIPLLGVWYKPEEIDFQKLPNQFVLKCNHDSHSIIICKDKLNFNKALAISKLNHHLNINGFWYGREWPYKNVKPLIIAEPYMYDEYQRNCLYDYKFFCFNGEPKIMYISNDNSSEAHTDFFDMDFNSLPIRMKDPNSVVLPKKPTQFDEMKEYARKLSKGFKHLRVDFYIVNSQVYVGELTFYHNGGFCKISPDEWNYKLGSWINI